MADDCKECKSNNQSRRERIKTEQVLKKWDMYFNGLGMIEKVSEDANQLSSSNDNDYPGRDICDND